ncbi:MAG: ABC transporter permease subunit [Bauldia sp.]|nr:ABC transporter permease subunit [Bauldia sp.]
MTTVAVTPAANPVAEFASRHAGWLIGLGALALWEVAGDYNLVAGGALPSPSEIIRQIWLDRQYLPRHIGATVWPALLGFLIGNTIAILAAITFVLWPPVERLTRGISITIFAIPAVALGPILVLTVDGIKPMVVLAAVSVYFPTMIAMLVGLKDIDPRPVDLIRAYGGTRRHILLHVRLRSSLPSLLAGLKVAAPAAVLGAILAEFGSGQRWGLGTYLLGSIGMGNPARIWEIGLIATAIASIGYVAFALIAGKATARTKQVTIASATPQDLAGTGGFTPINIAYAVGAAVVPFIAWWGIMKWLDLSPIIAKDPIGLWNYFFNARNSAVTQASLWDALLQSVPIAFLGLAIGLAVAFGLAVLISTRPRIGNVFLPVALVTQTMPLVAWAPIIVLLFGRDLTTTLIIAASVTFFPALVTILQGLSLVPRSALDVLRTYGASGAQQMRMVSIPSSIPYVMAAARVAVPRALLGVMIAEWLATGMGLGNLLNRARGSLDYGMIWTVAFTSVAISILFYQLVTVVERAFLKKYRAGSA